MPTFRHVVIVAGSYLLGGISTGYYLVRLTRGEDVRTSGSGSSGARNVGRMLGTRGFIVTAAGDTAKGAIIPIMARASGGSAAVVSLSSVAVVAGHVWPVQLGFRGGRGLTVALGALLATEPRVAGAVVVVAGGMFPLFRNLIGAGLTATATAPLIARLLGSSPIAVRGVAGMAAIVLAGHRHYLRRALPGGRKTLATGDVS